MNCSDVQSHAGVYLDGELDRLVHAEIDRHLAQCPVCTEVYGQEKALHALLKQHAPDFHETSQLRVRIEASLPSDRRPLRLFHLPPATWWRFARILALIAVIAWGFSTYQRGIDNEEDLRDAAITLHMRSLQESHLVDLAATEPVRLEQWFKDRLPNTPSVKDLSGHGYALVGGRLDYLYKRPLAVVVYRRQDKLINVLVWPASKTDHFPTSMLADKRFKIMFWARGGNNFCAISDLSQSEFARFVQVMRGL